MMTPSTTPERSASERLGTIIGDRYKLLSVLGEGGMGMVFLAEDRRAGGRVALKVLKREAADDEVVLARFEREAVTLKALAHEHIVEVLGYGKSPEGEVCLVLEHVEGETLRSVMKRAKPLPVASVLDIARQISLGLSRAHGLGVVHRDLKPENVMVTTAEGRTRLKILDFGMARLLTGGPSTPLTRKGAVFGTPEYMPPEQAMGQPVDQRADQYAFGVMLFEMLAGGRPFSAKSPLEMLQKHIREAPPKLRAAAPGTPVSVEAAVERMMAKTPADRFPDVASAAAALAACPI
jgi:eukaryotic-like serine/threonine-protein kinase